ncbi:hypothetical protein DA075_29230 [Methylobacterium currus]|uniref:Uncharacterized protein n=1 Tax=Methylobacterium currus TaxID=2051553 RepID=A0A2R4WSB5_9HYPH|nr:hypothetical protein [Methylobacterium currus]AWB24446.1 hypothetical protein DA075_29230 [Methylobacterium currus]UHC16213.1 hypothetical protein LRS73_27725 [Methylobacterium currus]
MHDLVASFVSMVLIQPLEEEMTQALRARHAPPAVIAAATACLRTAEPRLAARTLTEPWWTVSHSLRFWTGLSRPEAILVQVAPRCGEALEGAQRFLDMRYVRS